ncbi:MAG: YqeG family HAD IIIA-type phosphatase [Candidatus Margulisiibacteriota bacterium]|jgi:hypothetical protein
MLHYDFVHLLGDIITPDEYLDSIYSIDFDSLSKKGIKGLFVDMDNTLVGRYEVEPSLKCRSWIEAAKRAGFKLCISSNSFYPNRVAHVAKSLQLPAFFMAFKPFPWALNIASQKIMKLPKKEIAVIGDQLFTDIISGNLAEMYTILVDPMEMERFSPKKIMRVVEQVALRGYGVAMVRN